MERAIDIENEKDKLNKWVLKSMDLFENTPYLDNIHEVYPLEIARPKGLSSDLRRRIIDAHQSRNTKKLLEILKTEVKFPYDEPMWYLIKNMQGCEENNPEQVQRIAASLYSMTADEALIALGAAPKINTQMGPMFTKWTQQEFDLLDLKDFINSTDGIHLLNSSEEVALNFVNTTLGQNFKKRPDLVAKVNDLYIVGEAKWIGSSGGNQDKQVEEVLDFCKNQRGNVIRIGIIDGFPWAVYSKKGKIINLQAAVQVQESEYDIISALLLNDYLNSFKKN
jgi:hypothetical protein